MNVSPNRLVAVATPLVFAPLAGAITALAAKYAPGLEIDSGKLQAIFIAGASIAVVKSGLWMKGWQDFEKRQETMPEGALEPANAMTSLAAGDEPDMNEDTASDVEADGELESESAEDDTDGEFEAADADLESEGVDEDADDSMFDLDDGLGEPAEAEHLARA